MTTFERAAAFVLKREGGFSNHPADRGGATNKGITAAVYDAYRTKKGLALQSVKEITDEEVMDIYHEEYWTAGKCYLMPTKLAIVHFDAAVNCGVARAVKFLQNALGVIGDGVFGKETMLALKKCHEGAVVDRYLSARRNFYITLVAQKPSQSVFLKGWLSRTDALRREVSDC